MGATPYRRKGENEMKRTKECLGVALALMLAGTAQSAWNDRLMRCSTVGPDRYADGTRVGDGECYALVHTADGRTFAGFNADGTCVSTDSVVVAVAPVARDGRCPRVLFQVPREFADGHRGGRWELYLLDTRRADGRPAGLGAFGTAARVNRWGVASGKPEGPVGVPVKAARAAAIPPGAPRPRIAAMRVRDGKVALTVENTVPYLSYGIAGGKTPESVSGPGRGTGTVCDGDAGRPIVLETETTGDVGFYRVVRKEI